MLRNCGLISVINDEHVYPNLNTHYISSALNLSVHPHHSANFKRPLKTVSTILSRATEQFTVRLE